MATTLGFDFKTEIPRPGRVGGAFVNAPVEIPMNSAIFRVLSGLCGLPGEFCTPRAYKKVFVHCVNEILPSLPTPPCSLTSRSRSGPSDVGFIRRFSPR